MSTFESGARRPVSARRSAWAQWLALQLTRAGVAPNQVSCASVIVAALAAVGLLLAPRVGTIAVAAFLLAAACMELRLLCNLLDGMIAIEGGRATPGGPVWNELPDRLSDVMVLAAAGYSVAGAGGLSTLGWLATAMALLTAYVRALAGSLGAPQDFGGPMAKQQRMHVIAAACLFACLPFGHAWHVVVMTAAVAIVAAGGAITTARRTRKLVRELGAR